MAKQKKNKNQNFLTVFLAIVIIAFVYFGIQVIQLLKRPAETTIVKNGELIKYEEVVGYIVRDESVVDTTKYAGEGKMVVSDAKRVAINGDVIEYVSKYEGEYNQKIQEINEKIQDALESQTAIFSNDIKALDNEIQNIIYAFNNYENDVYLLAEYKSNVNEKIKKKSTIVGEISPSGSAIKKLINERQEYEKKIDDAKSTLKSDRAGLVSYRVDGYEEILTENCLESLTRTELEKIKGSVGQVIQIDISKLKIVNNFYCYIAIPINSQESKDAKVGDKVYLRFDNTGSSLITAEVEYILGENEERVIILKITKNTEELSKYRKINLDIVWWRDKGYKVPISSISLVDVLDENTGVVLASLSSVKVKKSNYTDVVWVKIIKEAGGFCIIENYTDNELIELGIPENQVNSRKTIKMYDDILVNYD